MGGVIAHGGLSPSYADTTLVHIDLYAASTDLYAWRYLTKSDSRSSRAPTSDGAGLSLKRMRLEFKFLFMGSMAQIVDNTTPLKSACNVYFIAPYGAVCSPVSGTTYAWIKRTPLTWLRGSLVVMI